MTTQASGICWPAWSDTLVESLLFGHSKGAFTSADRQQVGLIKQADGGTLFLDEVGELPLHIQKAFLRVLQERRFRPLGSRMEISSDFRLVAATNRNLVQMVEEGSFRDDLLFRLRSFVIELPPLRERTGDIQALTMHHLARLCQRLKIGLKGLAPEFLEAVNSYHWPGNVRELLHALERAVAAAAAEHTTQIASHAEVSLGSASTAMIVGLGAAMIIGLTMAFFLTRSIAGPIRRVISGLTEGAEQVASASTQVSSASQSLAEGASQQAAAIEETSSSLEEMSSMTRINAENAQQANGLMEEAKRIIHAANTSMGQLTDSMADISRASEETSKIIKTIDEIAFQTNLLALNAAVEAARAGAGFAVVADEVRNLAMRAADAARNTADLIEGTVKKVKDGSDLMMQTNAAFQQVADSSAKVAELVGEISAASGEQAQGIDQINRAVSEMDKVTQQNAANAEESAAASEQMNAQAETMKDMVGGDLEARTRVKQDGRNVQRGRVLSSRSHATVVSPADHRPIRSNGKVHDALLATAAGKSNSRDVIPLAGDGFSEF